MIEKYYNAKEAAKVLKRPIASFYRDVEAGLIPFEMEELKSAAASFLIIFSLVSFFHTCTLPLQKEL